uniref:Uncharacterized protein n=1 Tax=Myotis myotis TaxID=51298 RepID=A0A7J7RV43_MYOMY|nr:hypothetical protein mMyoMyo1_010126 [Myotis myotis]
MVHSHHGCSCLSPPRFLSEINKNIFLKNAVSWGGPPSPMRQGGFIFQGRIWPVEGLRAPGGLSEPPELTYGEDIGRWGPPRPGQLGGQAVRPAVTAAPSCIHGRSPGTHGGSLCHPRRNRASTRPHGQLQGPGTDGRGQSIAL